MGLGIERFMRHFKCRVDLTVDGCSPLSLEKIRKAKKLLFALRPDKEDAQLFDILLIAPQSLTLIENSIREKDNKIGFQELQNKIIEGIPYEVCHNLPYMTYIDKEYGTEAKDTDYRYYGRSNFLVTKYNVVRIESLEGCPHA